MKREILSIDARINENKYDNIVIDLYQDMIQLMKRYGSRYGATQITFDMSGNTCCTTSEAIVLPHLAYILTNYDKEHILKQLENMLDRQYMYPVKKQNDIWIICWRQDPSFEVMPLVTARDLNAMGYRVGHGSLYKDIMNGLKIALLQGKCVKTMESQITWVKKNFPQ